MLLSGKKKGECAATSHPALRDSKLVITVLLGPGRGYRLDLQRETIVRDRFSSSDIYIFPVALFDPG